MSFLTALTALLASTELALIAVGVAIALAVLVVVLVVRRSRGRAVSEANSGPPAPSQQRPVSKGRRFLGMVVDGLGIVLVTMGIATAVHLGQLMALGDAPTDHGTLASRVGVIVTFVAWAAVTLRTGRTVGDLVAGVRYVGGTRPEFLARALRFLGGIGGYMILANLPEVWANVSSAFLLVSVVMTFATASGRGLPGVLAGRHVVEARTGAASVEASS